MRLLVCLAAMTGVMILSGSLVGQPPTNPAPVDPKMDFLLGIWEKSTASMNSLSGKFHCTVKNVSLNDLVTQYEGQARFMRLPADTAGAFVHMDNKTNPGKWQRYLCTGSHIYVYRPSEKAIYFYQLPPQKAGQPLDQGPMAFLFGMKANQAKTRYKMTIKPPDPSVIKDPAARQQHEEWYTTLAVEPIFEADKANFLYAELLIMNKPLVTQTENIPAGMPRRIFWVEPNKDQVTWSIIELKRDEASGVQRSDFGQPQLPEGWQWKAGQSAAQPDKNPPNIIRPQQ
jgi:TIGR03009 family protein